MSLSHYEMMKATRVLRETVALYFPLLRLKPVKLFEVQDSVLFSESLVYKLDKAYEDGQKRRKFDETKIASISDELLNFLSPRISAPKATAFVEDINNYFKMETELIWKQGFNLDKVLKTWHLRSSDLRMNNEIFCRHFDKSLDPKTLEIVDKMWMIGEALYDKLDYEKDLNRETFNILISYEQLFGEKGRELFNEKLREIKKDVLLQSSRMDGITRHHIMTTFNRWEKIHTKYQEKDKVMLFDLNDLEIDKSAFIEEAKQVFYTDVEWDHNDTTIVDSPSFKPFRKRSFAEFNLELNENGDWNMQRVYKKFFVQPLWNYLPREFKQVEDKLIGNQLKQFIKKIASKLKQEFEPNAKKLHISLHFMQVFATDGSSFVVPEGIHKDGVDYIVSGLVVERKNITGGKSLIYDNCGSEILEITLKEGMGILQPDEYSSLLHSVTPIHRINEEEEAYRSIVGLDINVIE